MGGVAPKCNAAALALTSPSTPGLWCQSTTERLWHHKPGVLVLESASAAASGGVGQGSAHTTRVLFMCVGMRGT